MKQALSFRTILLLTLVGVAISSLILQRWLMDSVYCESIDDLSAALTQQTVQRVADRLDELVKTAVDHQRLYVRLAPDGELTSDQFPEIFQQLWATVEPHDELSYLGVGIAETGEYAMLKNSAGEPLTVRMYVRDPLTGPEIRDYRPSVRGLELLARTPWTNSGDPKTTYDLKLRPFYVQAAKARRGAWTDSYLFWGGTAAGEIPGVTFATPIYDDAGQLTLVWDIDLELRTLSRFLQRVQQQIPGRLLIAEHRADNSWRLIAEPTVQPDADGATVAADAAAKAFLRSLPPDFSEAAALTESASMFDFNGKEWQATCAMLEGPDRPEWLIAQLSPTDAAPRPAPLSGRWSVATFLTAGLFASVTAWWVSRLIAAPLLTLEQQARGLAAGERTQIPLVGSPDEIGKLSQTLNSMALAVQQRQQALEQAVIDLRMSRERLRAHIDRTPVGALEVDPQGCIVDWNSSAEQIFGWAFAEVRGRHFEFIVPEAIRPQIDAIVESLFRREGGFRSDNQNVTKDGRLIDCEWYNTPLVDLEGRTFGIACLVLDATERKRAEAAIRELNEQLESRVRQRTAELQTALQDLESFSYSVAHDLRAPLRSIDGFSLALAEDCGDALSPDCAAHLHRIRAATQRMGSLIDALLRLARVARSDVHHEAVDLTELAQQALLQRQAADPQRNVELRLTPGLMVVGDRQLLRSLMDNLCDNAWKYTRVRSPAIIELIVEERPDGRWFGVGDNGVGFDAEYAHKAIEPFQRLHRVEDYEGHGIGLATAALIARKHGGDVYLVARPEGGAVCWFRLEPARSAATLPDDSIATDRKVATNSTAVVSSPS